MTAAQRGHSWITALCQYYQRQLRFNAGNNYTTTVTVSTVPDTLDDEDRELVLSYSEATGTGADDIPDLADTTVTIIDDELPIASVSTSATTITEAAVAAAVAENGALPSSLADYDCTDNSYCARVTISLSSASAVPFRDRAKYKSTTCHIRTRRSTQTWQSRQHYGGRY